MQLKGWWALGLTACSAGGAAALDVADWLRLEGFGTLGVYAGDDDVATVRADLRNPTASRAHQWRADGDSQLSAQFTVNPQGPWRAALQLLAKDDFTDRFRPRVEWLYASYDLTPEVNVKAGRLVLPAFLLSDTRNVAYSQVTARPVNTVYVLNTATNMDGLSASVAERLGRWDVGADLALGRSRVEVPTGVVDVPRIATATFKLGPAREGAWHVRYGRTQVHVKLNLPSVAAALAALSADSPSNPCANCSEVFARRLRFEGVRAAYDTLAWTYEPGAWRLQAEWARRTTNSTQMPDARAYYLQAGYRVEAWTPYLVWGKVKYTEPPLDLVAKPGYPAGASAAVAAIDRYLQQPLGRVVWQAGLRWDFADRMALKVQYESFRNNQEFRYGQVGIVSSPSPPPIGAYQGPAWDGKVGMTTVNLDFVF